MPWQAGDRDRGDHDRPFGESETYLYRVRAVNRVGATPGDLVAILQALKQVGALRAELMVI
mgnify:CR=1 FL=1